MKSIYNDRWLMITGSLLLGYFFVTIGQDEGLFALWSRPDYGRDIVGAALMTGPVWSLVRVATVWLDHRYDWFEQPARRFAGQFMLGFMGPVVLSAILSALYFRFVVGQPIADSTYPVYEFPITILVIGLFNLLYFSLYLYRKATTPPPSPTQPDPEPESIELPQPQPPTTTRKTLIVSSGLRNVPVFVDDVAYIYIDEATLFLHTFSGSKYVVSNSLDELSRDLPNDIFFRVNRQFIIHRRACSSYLNDTYGKVKVEVKPALPRDIVVSQQRTPEFKKWLEEGF